MDFLPTISTVGAVLKDVAWVEEGVTETIWPVYMTEPREGLSMNFSDSDEQVLRSTHLAKTSLVRNFPCLLNLPPQAGVVCLLPQSSLALCVQVPVYKLTTNQSVVFVTGPHKDCPQLMTQHHLKQERQEAS